MIRLPGLSNGVSIPGLDKVFSDLFSNEQFLKAINPFQNLEPLRVLLEQVITPVISKLVDIVTKLDDIHNQLKILESVDLAASELFRIKDIAEKLNMVFDVVKFFSDMSIPVMELLKDPVFKDLVDSVREAKDLAARAQDPSGAPVPMKNMDPATLIRMLALSNIPVAGGIIKGMVKTAKMAEYQERIGRGFASKLDEIDFYLSDSGLGNIIAPMLSVENVPKWFLRGKK